MSDRQTQRARLLALMMEAKAYSWVEPDSGWVDARDFPQKLGILSYTRRLFELRQEGWDIRIEDKYVGRQRITRYRLVGKK